MTLIFETNDHVARRDRIGFWLLQHKESGRSVYLQGDDARQFARDTRHLPVAALDQAISNYSEVMS